MAKETKIGLALCVLLIGAFSFVVYSKMNKQPRLEDEFAAGTDSSIEDAPPPFEGDTHADFGGEPDHHHGHDHDHGDNEPFTSDSESTADNFDVPQRRRRKHNDDFHQIADTRNGLGRQQSDDPWQSSRGKNPDRHSHNQRQAGGNDDPFAEASHRHAHDDTRQREPGFGDESEFGFEQDEPVEQVEAAKPEKKAWNLADFLGGKDKEADRQQARQSGHDDTPFGQDASDTASTADANSKQGDDFNPFASTEQAADTHDQKIQQSAGRAVVDDHDHGHKHENAFGDDQEFDSWGTDASNDRSGFENTQQRTAAQSGSQTQVEEPSNDTNEFGFPDDALVTDDSHDQANDFSGDKFRTTPPAPRPDRQVGRGEHGQHDHFGQDDLHNEQHDEFSQPFSNSDDHHHGGHQHSDDGHFLPNPDGASSGNDRPNVYVVQRGDNFWDISRKQYGAGRYYKALALYNRNRIPDPRKMRPGMKVLIPRPETLAVKFPTLCPWQTAKPTAHTDHSHHHQSGFFTNTAGQPRYRVDSRDTLTDIAKDHLGRASRWVQVYALNRDRITDPAKLKIGTILRLPADASRVQLVRRSHGHR